MKWGISFPRQTYPHAPTLYSSQHSVLRLCARPVCREGRPTEAETSDRDDPTDHFPHRNLGMSTNRNTSASIALFMCALLTPRHRKGREGHNRKTTALHDEYF